jgi:hypothetical protein
MSNGKYVKYKLIPVYVIKTYMESRGIDPLILNLCSVVSLTLRPLYP